ncbi:choline monooxygenase [Labrenzia sp. EL_208]|nr:choline monooxygenase [Labrenzia sp. EL_132]MBG6228197.1 choline monooxygenase [Labrenzia sp. EL_208]
MGAIETLLEPFFEETSPRRGLPAAAYTDKEFWDAECMSVFTRNWICVGFVHELKVSGDAVPIKIAGHPLLLVRNKEGAIRAFHNVCRHRCLTLVEEPRNVGKLIRCPYHAWAYDLDGNLRASPHFGGVNEHFSKGFDRKQNGLVPVRTHIWNDWIFVNIDGDAEPFEDYASTIKERLNGIEWENLNCIGTLDFGEIACNWKFIMENFIEPYHVQFVHASTTDQPLEDHFTIIDGNCLGSAVDLQEEIGTSGSLGVSSRYLTLYPNFILGRYFPDQMGVYLNIPTGPGTMMQKRALYTTDGQSLSEEAIRGLRKLWWDVHKEDHEMTERLQLGRASQVSAAGGVLSPAWEDSVRAFQDMVARDVTSRKLPKEGIYNDNQ